tara:strand:+ start:17104 stop:17871 length:768 start_codon:yes stop_codon:yes gene_type:complete
MNNHWKLIILVLFTLISIDVSAQSRRSTENYFGFQFKPLIPFGLVGDRPFEMQEANFRTTVSPAFGYSYGAAVRVGLTELLALETGINYTKRNFNLEYEVADSNIAGQDNFGFVNFEVPVNALVYIKLGRQAYMNTSIGASANYNPSNIRTSSNPEGAHLFIFEGRRFAFFDFHINANVGFEYRTKESGIFYAGISGRIPFRPLMQVAAEYSYDTYDIVSFGLVEGATFSFDLKYFFHNNKRKKGVQFNEGPIEQ